MIDQKKIRTLLKKIENKFISKNTVSRILNLDNKAAIETFTYLENQGFIEKADIDELWQLSLRGKLLSNKKFGKEYKLDTMKQHLCDLIERAKEINSSAEYPDYITCIKVTSEYPIEQRSNGIHVAYSLRRKEITEEERRSAEKALIKKYARNVGTILERIYFSEKAIGNYLKFGSHVLKLRQYDRNKIQQREGYEVFRAD